MAQATSPTDRERAQVVDRRAHELEDRLARDRRENRPSDQRKAAGSATDKPLPNRNARVVRPR